MRSIYKYCPYIVSFFLMGIVYPLFYFDYWSSTYDYHFFSIAQIYLPIFILVLLLLVDLFYGNKENQSVLQKINLPVIISIHFCTLSYLIGLRVMSGWDYVLPILPLLIPIIFYCVINKVKIISNWLFYLIKYCVSSIIILISMYIYICIAYIQWDAFLFYYIVNCFGFTQ